MQAALEAVGHGVLQHPANGELVSKLQSGALSIQDFFRQPLRLVHQLLFLCVAEDRGLLFPPGVSLERRRIYHQGYSLSRLRLPKPANSALAGSEASGEQEAAEQGAGTSVRTFSGPADRQD